MVIHNLRFLQKEDEMDDDTTTPEPIHHESVSETPVVTSGHPDNDLDDVTSDDEAAVDALASSASTEPLEDPDGTD